MQGNLDLTVTRSLQRLCENGRSTASCGRGSVSAMYKINGLASHDHREWWIPRRYHTDSAARGSVQRRLMTISQHRARSQRFPTLFQRPLQVRRAIYTRSVRRIILASSLFAGVVFAQQQPAAQKKQTVPPSAKQEEEPPEEDESLKPKEYTLNPLESARNVTAGNFYFKKGNYRASARRFEEATKWDPGNAEAFLKLGESDEKLKDRHGARDAYTKYVELAPDGKNTEEVKKRLGKLTGSSAKN
jgi:tetratricopeptide (TPR) repeat protein